MEISKMSKTIKEVLEKLIFIESFEARNKSIDQALLDIQEIINECIGEDEKPTGYIDEVIHHNHIGGRLKTRAKRLSDCPELRIKNSLRKKIRTNLEKRLK
jgi:hypothetical protein